MLTENRVVMGSILKKFNGRADYAITGRLGFYLHCLKLDESKEPDFRLQEEYVGGSDNRLYVPEPMKGKLEKEVIQYADKLEFEKQTLSVAEASYLVLEYLASH